MLSASGFDFVTFLRKSVGIVRRQPVFCGLFCGKNGGCFSKILSESVSEWGKIAKHKEKPDFFTTLK